MQALIRSKSAGNTGGRGTAGAGPGRDLLYLLLRPPHPTQPHPAPPLVVFCLPLCFLVSRARRQLPPPPPPGVCVSRPVASCCAFTLFASVPCGCSALLGRLSAPPVAPPPPPGFVFRGCCRPAARLPLFSLCLPVASRCLAVCPPPIPPICVSWVSSPCRSFSCVLLLLPCCFRAFGLGTCLAGFLFPPSARGLSCVWCVARWCRAPPPAVAPCGARCPASCCVVPRWPWAVLCGAQCFAAPCCAVVRVPCCVVCCSVVLLASSLTFSCWRWPRRFCWCRTVLRCAALFCVVFRRVCCRRALSCAVVFSLLLCILSLLSPCSLSAFPVLRTRGFAPPGVAPLPRFVCPAFCRFVLPCCAALFCALCCCVAACCIVLLGVRRAVSCCAVSCCALRVVWCCTAFPRAAAPCYVLCSARWRCAVLSCVAPFAGVLRLGTLCCAVLLCAVCGFLLPSGVRWRCAVGCMLCCAVVCCCVLCCAFGCGVWLRCAVLSSLWLAV